MHRRRFSAEALQATWLRARRAQWPEGYHGVAIVSKIPFESSDVRTFCGKIDSRIFRWRSGEGADRRAAGRTTTSTCPQAAIFPTPHSIRNSSSSSRSLTRCGIANRCIRRLAERHILVGDLNVAPHETRRVVAQAALKDRRIPRSSATNCSPYRPMATGSISHDSGFRCPRRSTRGGVIAPPTERRQQGPPARSYLGLESARRSVQDFRITKEARGWEAAIGSCAGDSGSRRLKLVAAGRENYRNVADTRVMAPMAALERAAKSSRNRRAALRMTFKHALKQTT